jgi:hypothetical protein
LLQCVGKASVIAAEGDESQRSANVREKSSQTLYSWRARRFLLDAATLALAASMVSTTYIANLPMSWRVAGVGDFNADAKTDILWRNSGAGDAMASLMNGASIVSSTWIANLPRAQIVAAPRKRGRHHAFAEQQYLSPR